MSDPRESIAPALPRWPQPYWLRLLAIVVAIPAATLLVLTGGNLGALATIFGQASWKPHVPDWTPLVEAGAVVWLHVFTMAAALVVGVVLLGGPKGRRMHRTLGWLWVSLLIATAVDTLFIRGPEVGPTMLGFSPLHAVSVWVLATAPLGVYFARRHKVARHRAMMTGLFVGGLVVAGLATIAPGRIMHAMLFG